MSYLIGRYTPTGMLWYTTQREFGEPGWTKDVTLANYYSSYNDGQQLISQMIAVDNAKVFAVFD